MKASVIATVYNERANIDRLLSSLVEQTLLPDEVVICDGGSTDGTVEVIRSYQSDSPQLPFRLRLLTEPGANISRGRNLAIAAADGPIIAVTDAGVRLAADWLEHLITPWAAQDGTAEATVAVAGFFLPDVEGAFQTAMAATVLPLHADVDPERFLPSSRSVAFRKENWQVIGGYPEWLDYCEDLVFDLRFNACFGRGRTAFAWAPDAIAYFRPRDSLGAFWRQYYCYARGDGKADLWRKRHAIRYLVYFIAMPALVGYAIWGRYASWLGWVGLAAGVMAYCRRPWARIQEIGRELPFLQRLWAWALVPVIRGTGDLAKMAGYPVGGGWRWRNRLRQEIHWRSKIGKRNATSD